MDRFSRYSHGVLFAFLFLVAVPAAAVVPPVTPIGLDSLVKSGISIAGRIEYQIGQGTGSTYLTKGISYSALTMGKLAKGALKGGLYGILLDQALDQAALLWNAGTEEAETAGDPGGYPCLDGTYRGSFFGDIPKTCDVASADVLLRARWVQNYASSFGWSVTSISVQSGSLVTGGQSNQIYEICTEDHGCWEGQDGTILYFSGGTGTQPEIPGGPITDEELGENIIDHGDPLLWEQLLTDPATGMPITTDEVSDGIWQVQQEQVEQDGGDPETVPQPTPTGSTATGSSEATPESELPGFCSWATVVCDLAEWFRNDPEEPTPPELPLSNVPIPSGWNSGLGSSACPPASTVTIWEGTVIEIPWQPACDGADILRPILLAMAYFIAAGILIGRRT